MRQVPEKSPLVFTRGYLLQEFVGGVFPGVIPLLSVNTRAVIARTCRRINPGNKSFIGGTRRRDGPLSSTWGVPSFTLHGDQVILKLKGNKLTAIFVY